MRKSAPLFCALLLSLSARRAWIEIDHFEAVLDKYMVALRKESVDRNYKLYGIMPWKISRSPQGERG